MEPMAVPMLAGASAGVVARIACHPIDTIKSKLQVAFERARLHLHCASVHVRLPSGTLTITSAPSPGRTRINQGSGPQGAKWYVIIFESESETKTEIDILIEPFL